MKQPEVIKVRSTANAMVPDVPALESNMRRFIGWKWVAPLVIAEKKEDQIPGTWEQTGPVEVVMCKEYRDAIKAGELIAVV